MAGVRAWQLHQFFAPASVLIQACLSARLTNAMTCSHRYSLESKAVGVNKVEMLFT